MKLLNLNHNSLSYVISLLIVLNYHVLKFIIIIHYHVCLEIYHLKKETCSQNNIDLFKLTIFLVGAMANYGNI